MRVTGTALALAVAVYCFFYPFVFICRLMSDPGLTATGQPTALPEWFRETAHRYDVWAEDYLESERATNARKSDVAGTEWPMFGSVFFMLAAEELAAANAIDVDLELRSTLDRAARVIADPATATWVRRLWGDDYLEHDNVFYRMLLLLGLSSYERITNDSTYHGLIAGQAEKLARELDRAPYHLADDYPGECYPNDVLWAAAAVRRVGTLDGKRYDSVGANVLETLNGPVRTIHGLPSFQVNARTADMYQPARGSANSGILSFAGELDPELAQRWYKNYIDHYWVDGFIQGFREVPGGSPDITDVDSGPVVFGIGSVATAFGIGAARAAGRFDHASALTLETLAVAWPTPFGLLVPGTMGSVAADGWCFGELALHFAMTRPTWSSDVVTSDGSAPPFAWLMLGLYLGGGLLIVGREGWYWRKRLGNKRRS